MNEPYPILIVGSSYTQFLYFKPFIVNLLAQRLQTIEKGNHIIAVYPSKEEKFNEAFSLSKGWSSTK